jgi:hypothetical protein
MVPVVSALLIAEVPVSTATCTTAAKQATPTSEHTTQAMTRKAPMTALLSPLSSTEGGLGAQDQYRH